MSEQGSAPEAAGEFDLTPEKLGEILLVRQQLREQEAEAALACLSPREQQLVREAAVMGFALARAGRYEPHEPHPKDSAVLRNVLLSCRSFPDIYPLLGRLGQEPEPTPEA